MAKTRRTFTPEFKAEAVRRIGDQGKSRRTCAAEDALSSTTNAFIVASMLL